MLKAFVQEIANMAKVDTFHIGGDDYSTKPIFRVEPHKDTPKAITLTGLDSVCKMVRNEAVDLFPGDQILIQVSNYRTVNVFTTLDGDMDRCNLYRCEADTPSVTVNRYMDQESAIIQLRSLYIPNEGTKYLLDLFSSISKEVKETTNDNGVTQVVEARQGVALKEMVAIKPNVELRPFRTFLEVPQPESTFLFRIKDGDIGLFEADGGVWKLEATRNIAKYFEDQLKELIDSGKVVILR